MSPSRDTSHATLHATSHAALHASLYATSYAIWHATSNANSHAASHATSHATSHAGKRYDMDDDFISGYLTRMSEVNQLRQGNVITVHFFPWIQRLMTKAMFNRFTQLPKIIKTVKEMNSLFKVRLLKLHPAAQDH